MKKHFIIIILLLLSIAVTCPAEARLTLGVVVGSDSDASVLSRDQVKTLAGLLAEKFQEDIVVKEMSDAATVVNWLSQFAALDLALLSTEDVIANRGRLLLIGPLDKQGRINLVSRQGASGDLPDRAAAIVEESGFTPWRTVAEAVISEPIAAEESPPGDDGVMSIDDVIDAQVELSGGVGKATIPEQQKAPARLPPEAGTPVKKLSLAVIPELQGVLQSRAQAEQLAEYLESVMPVDVSPREFDSLDGFADWFMRYRMVDLAVLPQEVAEAKLGRDYIDIAEIVHEGSDGKEATELLIGRRGQDRALQDRLRDVLLKMEETDHGKALLAGLHVSRLQGPADELAERPAVDQPMVSPAVVGRMEVDKTGQTARKMAEAIEESAPLAMEFPDPVEPVAPPEMIAVVEPSVPDLSYADVPPEPAAPDLVPDVPAITKQPGTPVQPELLGQPVLPERPVVAAAPKKIETPEEPGLLMVESKPEPPVVVEMPVPSVPEPPEAPEAVSAVDEAANTQETTMAVAEISAPVEPLAPVAVPYESLDKPVVNALESAEPVAGGAPAVVEAEAVPEKTFAAEPSVAAISEDPADTEQAKIIEEVLQFAEPISTIEDAGIRSVTVDDTTGADDEILAFLGEDSVAALVAQPDIPQELRPPGIPVVRPGRVKPQESALTQGLLLTSLPDPIPQKDPERPPQLLPEPEPEPGIVYIVPFVSVMVPKEVNDRIFDQFVDSMITKENNLDLQFVILKEGLQRVSPQWLQVRKYVTGEIYAYVEDAGSTATDLRAKARITYHVPSKTTPAFGFIYPVSRFLDNNATNIEEERIKLADNIADVLVGEFIKALQN